MAATLFWQTDAALASIPQHWVTCYREYYSVSPTIRLRSDTALRHDIMGVLCEDDMGINHVKTVLLPTTLHEERLRSSVNYPANDDEMVKHLCHTFRSDFPDVYNMCQQLRYESPVIHVV